MRYALTTATLRLLHIHIPSLASSPSKPPYASASAVADSEVFRMHDMRIPVTISACANELQTQSMSHAATRQAADGVPTHTHHIRRHPLSLLPLTFEMPKIYITKDSAILITVDYHYYHLGLLQDDLQTCKKQCAQGDIVERRIRCHGVGITPSHQEASSRTGLETTGTCAISK